MIDRLLEIQQRADRVAQDALERMATIVKDAESIVAETSDVRAELEQFLAQFSLESGLNDTDSGLATFAGGVIDLQAMRADVAVMALNAAKAEILTSSLVSIQTALSAAARHFRLDTALTSTLDARVEGWQAALTTAREDERRKLAREIHDGPAQVLANAVYHVQIIQEVIKRNPTAIDEELKRLRELLKEGVTEVRRYMFDLRPTALEDLGLVPTLHRYVDDWGRFFGHSLTTNISPILPKLLPDQDLAVFRIVQQSLQNIHQHAGNDCTVAITVDLDGGMLVVRIADDGQGFDPALVSPKMQSGAGLMGMRERAATVHATLNIESKPGAGSVITLSMPVNGPEDAAAVTAVVRV